MARRLRNHLMSYIPRFLWRKKPGVLQGILGRGVPPDSPNSDPFSDLATKKYCRHYLEQQPKSTSNLHIYLPFLFIWN